MIFIYLEFLSFFPAWTMCQITEVWYKTTALEEFGEEQQGSDLGLLYSKAKIKDALSK